MRATYAYPADIETDEDGAVIVTFPDFGWGVTDGDTLAEALVQAEDCLGALIATTMWERRELPIPSAAQGRPVVPAPPLIAAKAALYQAMRDEGLTNVALAERMHTSETEVCRWLNPRLATKIAALDEALRALGWRLEVSVRAA